MRAQELCDGRGDWPGLPVPNKPDGFCGREATLKNQSNKQRNNNNNNNNNKTTTKQAFSLKQQPTNQPTNHPANQNVFTTSLSEAAQS